jgi:3-hydroxy-9,10-secoandrosta-1,3,5(10)-triene-9,17-dione monooxygenase reductase component
VNRDGISQGLALIPSGVFVVAAEDNGQRAAMLASFVQQSGFDPPSVTVAVNSDRPLLAAIKNSRRFAISTMSAESKDSLKRFWQGVPEGTDPFDGLLTETHETGIPILKDAVAFLECELDETLDAGDHVVCIGRVINGGRILENEPMVRIRKDGFEY